MEGHSQNRQAWETVASALEVRDRLADLFAERAQALASGLAEHGLYGSALEDEITATEAAYVGAAVTEIATLRGELFGRQRG
jgi:hypothetical protein